MREKKIKNISPPLGFAFRFQPHTLPRSDIILPVKSSLHHGDHVSLSILRVYCCGAFTTPPCLSCTPDGSGVTAPIIVVVVVARWMHGIGWIPENRSAFASCQGARKRRPEPKPNRTTPRVKTGGGTAATHGRQKAILGHWRLVHNSTRPSSSRGIFDWRSDRRNRLIRAVVKVRGRLTTKTNGKRNDVQLMNTQA